MVTEDKEQKKRDNIFWQPGPYCFEEKNGKVTINGVNRKDLPKRSQNRISFRRDPILESIELTEEELKTLDEEIAKILDAEK